MARLHLDPTSFCAAAIDSVRGMVYMACIKYGLDILVSVLHDPLTNSGQLTDQATIGSELIGDSLSPSH